MLPHHPAYTSPSPCFTLPLPPPALCPSHLKTFHLRHSIFTRPFSLSRFHRSKLHSSTPTCKSNPPRSRSDPPSDSSSDFNSLNDWLVALQGLFLEALKTYYQSTPMYTESEFETLRDEVQYLGSAHIRLDDMEKLWMQATNARDFDRRVCQEFDMSHEELNVLKNRLLTSGLVERPKVDVGREMRWWQVEQELDARFLKDADKIEAGERVDERLKWLLFSDASEERLKILLLYLPAVLMSFVTASVLTILFALLDGEMTISVTTAGRFRLGILSYVVVLLTIWFSNQVTPVMLDYLDLGQPTLIRGDCPICGATVACLFTGAVRIRDERKCSVCGSQVGFNRKHCKVYLVAPPGIKKQQPD